MTWNWIWSAEDGLVDPLKRFLSKTDPNVWFSQKTTEVPASSGAAEARVIVPGAVDTTVCRVPANGPETTST